MKTNKFKLFVNSNAYKSAFTFLSLISILVLSIIILFSIDSVPLSKELVVKTSYKTSLLAVIWYGGSVINKNLHISKHGDMLSYLIAIFINSFLITLVVLRWDYNPKDEKSLFEHYYYFMGIFLIKFIWFLNLYFFEKNMRPYFAKYLFWQAIASLLISIFIFVSKWKFERYFLDRAEYDHLEILNLLVIWFMPIVFVLLVFALFKSYSQITKYANDEKNILRSIIVWNSFVRITSLFIWSAASLTISLNNLKLYDKIFMAILAFCFLTSFTVMIFSIVKKYNRFLVYTFTMNLVIMSVSGFVFVNILKSNPSFTFLSFMIYIVLFQFMFIIVKPKLYRFYPQLNSFLTSALGIFILITWTGNKILGEINFSSINELMWGLILVSSLFMSILYISVEFFMSVKINRSFVKIIKSENMQKIKIRKVFNNG